MKSSAVEISNRRGCERSAEGRHPLFPLFVADHRQSLDVRKMFKVELDVVSQGADLPTVKISHLEKHTNLHVLLDETLEGWNELPIVIVGELTSDLYFQNSAAVLFVQL